MQRTDDGDDGRSKGEQLAGEIADAVNGGINPVEFREQLQREHNALQQRAFAEVLKPGIVALAGTPYTDARNERAVEECREIADAMGWDY
jgi:hypothetical protein